ncbi:MAG: response regulator [Firmicutes bacterium]|nr:response regulator [Bacillota bacterium]
MITPKLPPDENMRLQTIRDLQVLDTLPEERYDRIVRVAREIFRVPTVVITIVDANRQWFKARIGMLAAETSRDISFCGHAILQDEVMVIEDASADERFWDNPLVVGAPFIHFYAGNPVRARNGQKVGTLCLIDNKARHFSETERQHLKDLSKWVEAELDIVHRTQLEKTLTLSEERLRLLTEATIEGLSVQRNGVIRDVNRQFARIFGYETIEDVIGIQALSLVPTEVQADIRERLAESQSSYRFTAVRRDGSHFRAEVEARNVHIGNEMVRVAAVRDVTIQENIERTLRESSEKAMAATLAKSQFLATMSHEIRTPMNAIIGMADLLMETSLTFEQRRYVEVFQRSGDQLLKLINDILDLSKIESGQLELESLPFSVREVMEVVADVIAPRAHTKRLEIAVRVDPDVPEQVIGDADRLRQIILNLAGNAIKFTESGEILLEVSVDHTRNHVDTTSLEPIVNKIGASVLPDQRIASPRWTTLHFGVRDTGIGIPEEKLETVFEPFTQADASTSRKYGGSGLGLDISRQLVERMGGSIGVISEVGKGSTFYFCVPLEVEQEVNQGENYNGQVGVLSHKVFSGKRLLVIDDNRTNRFVIGEMLVSCGAVVKEAASGYEALRLIETARKSGYGFDAVLLDAQMPDLDGYQTALRLRDDAGVSMSRVILLTSDHRPGDAERARDAGIVSYLVKPVKKYAVVQAVHNALINGGPIREQDPHGKLASSEPQAKRILLAEDSEDNRFLIQQYLKEEPYFILLASDGREAVEIYSRECVDLILMDIQMPEVDGYTATRQIRQLEKNTGKLPVPILALSANSLPGDAEKSMQAGCTSHLTKPIRKGTLLKALEDHLVRDGHIVVKVETELKPLIPGYLERRSGDVKAIWLALREGHLDVIQTLAHKMKGSGSGYGFDFISECGSKMELAAQRQNTDLIKQILAEFETYLSRVQVVYEESSLS